MFTRTLIALAATAALASPAAAQTVLKFKIGRAHV